MLASTAGDGGMSRKVILRGTSIVVDPSMCEGIVSAYECGKRCARKPVRAI
jgi:hypothetical protein